MEIAGKQVGVIAQARFASARLPGKILRPIAGRPMMEHHFRRLSDAGLPVFLATSSEASDDPVATWSNWLRITVCPRITVQCIAALL